MSMHRERGIPEPNLINAGWMAGQAEGRGGYYGEEREGCGLLLQAKDGGIAQGSAGNSNQPVLPRKAVCPAIMLP